MPFWWNSFRKIRFLKSFDIRILMSKKITNHTPRVTHLSEHPTPHHPEKAPKLTVPTEALAAR